MDCTLMSITWQRILRNNQITLFQVLVKVAIWIGATFVIGYVGYGNSDQISTSVYGRYVLQIFTSEGTKGH